MRNTYLLLLLAGMLAAAEKQINFELAAGSDVTFEVTDISGRKVMELNKGIMSAGKHTIELETGNLEAGIYFYTMRAGNFVKTRQLVVR
ncbi:MAG: T9SS type A sorting domain-containing protein [Bacteroidales bacterium]